MLYIIIVAVALGVILGTRESLAQAETGASVEDSRAYGLTYGFLVFVIVWWVLGLAYGAAGILYASL